MTLSVEAEVRPFVAHVAASCGARPSSTLYIAINFTDFKKMMINTQ